MEKNYKVYRNSIWVGPVKRISTIDGNNRFFTNNYKPYRSMLFTINDSQLASDLLYDSPEYPILNISQESDCINSEIVISDSYNLEELLSYFNYNEVLTIENIIEIRRKFFTGTFIRNNSELFGIGVKKEQLPFKYYEILEKLGDNSFGNVIHGGARKRNAFTPSKEEGPIKKLARF